jgi:hypothetical protein
MKEVHLGLSGFPIAHRIEHWASRRAEDIVALVTMNQDTVRAESSDNVLAKVPGYPFRPVTPEDDSPIAIDKAYASLKLFQDRSIDVRMIDFRHKKPRI